MGLYETKITLKTDCLVSTEGRGQYRSYAQHVTFLGLGKETKAIAVINEGRWCMPNARRWEIQLLYRGHKTAERYTDTLGEAKELIAGDFFKWIASGPEWSTAYTDPAKTTLEALAEEKREEVRQRKAAHKARKVKKTRLQIVSYTGDIKPRKARG